MIFVSYLLQIFMNHTETYSDSNLIERHKSFAEKSAEISSSAQQEFCTAALQVYNYIHSLTSAIILYPMRGACTN